MPTHSAALSNSPMQIIRFKGRPFHLKRDDLLHPQFSGNKARKFAYLLDADLTGITKIIGHGSIQANSLYSIAALAKLKGLECDFYVSRLPQWLAKQPSGNYAGALELGTNIIEVDLSEHANLDAFMRDKAKTLPANELFVPEGGRSPLAQQGIKQLAEEIKHYCQTQKLNQPLIMLPSGTGTTAVFLQQHLPYQVLTCACVGGEDYLKQQFSELQPNSQLWPQILPSPKKYHFGKLYPEFYQIWQDLNQETNVEFELLYDPLAWLSLLNYLEKNTVTRDYIYIHQGGLVGNQSMLPRYQRKYG